MFTALPRILGRSLAAAVVALTLGTGSAQAATPLLDAEVLVGPTGADLVVSVPPGTETVRKLTVSIVAPEGTVKPRHRVAVFLNRPVKDGRATIGLGRAPRGSNVTFEARLDDKPGHRDGRAVARLRPDLRVVAVHAPLQTLTTRPIDVVVDLEEALEDNGAEATLTLLQGGVPVAAAKTVDLGAGGTASPVFEDVLLGTASRAELTARIDLAEPAEYDAGNNEGSTEIEVTEHELVRSNILVQSLGGYGAQFNNHVYAPITPWPAGTALRRLRGQGAGPPAAHRPHLLQRQLGREPERPVPGLGAELRVVRAGRPPGAGGRARRSTSASRTSGTRGSRRCRT